MSAGKHRRLNFNDDRARSDRGGRLVIARPGIAGSVKVETEPCIDEARDTLGRFGEGGDDEIETEASLGADDILGDIAG